MSHTKTIRSTAVLSFLTLIATVFFAFSAYAAPGEWDKQEFKIKGSWSITQQDGQKVLTLSDDFKTKGAPDLKLFLSKKNPEQINGKNATEQAVLVSKLESKKGGQSYIIPSDINVDDYTSLILHCEQYSKLWGATTLK